MNLISQGRLKVFLYMVTKQVKQELLQGFYVVMNGGIKESMLFPALTDLWRLKWKSAKQNLIPNSMKVMLRLVDK